MVGGHRHETDELPVLRLRFQTSPTASVDDLGIEAENGESRTVVRVAAPHAALSTKSDVNTAELVAALLDQIDTFSDDVRVGVAIAVAGMTGRRKRVQSVASLARDKAAEAEWVVSVREPKRPAGYAIRYDRMATAIKTARPTATEDNLRRLVWSLLNRLACPQRSPFQSSTSSLCGFSLTRLSGRTAGSPGGDVGTVRVLGRRSQSR